MYNIRDIQFVGNHDFSKNIIAGWNVTFSVGIFKWELKSNGKAMKKGKTVVRVYGVLGNEQKVFEVAESIVKKLDEGNWDGRKTVKVY